MSLSSSVKDGNETVVDSYEYSTDEAIFDNNSAELFKRNLLNFVRLCDIEKVKDLLESNNDFNINCKNYQGMTGLNLAIEANCEPMVDLLLSQPGIEIGDSLMHAIVDNHYAIVVKLLDILQSVDPERVKMGYDNSNEFPPHLTPLMLAAQCGHFRIISLLLKRGHEITIPHKPQCTCLEVCKSMGQLRNGLGAAEYKLALFRALSNPTYISLTSEDPVLTAFRLSQVLDAHGNVDCIFKSDYVSLNMQTRLFAVSLISLCRSYAEVELILSRKEGCTFFGSFPYHRLVMAMDLKQKEFVAHAYVQQILEMEWTGNWYEWRRYGAVQKSCMVFSRIFKLPWVIFLYLFLPYSKSGNYYALPVNRMLNYLASYSIYLLVLTIENNLEKTSRNVDPFNWYLKFIIILYAMSFAVRTAKLLIIEGPSRYFSMLWNAYDNVKLAILLATFACWWLSYADETNETSVAHPSSERKYWKSSDPTLVAEGLLAVVTVMSYLRLLFLCQLNYSLGPMQVSLGKMTTDFARVAILFAIVILAFMAGLCNFYQYYGGMTRTDSVTGYEVSQDESFTSLRATLKTLFWSVFCMTSANAGSVVIEAPASVTDDGVAEDVANNHYFTQAVGTFLYSIFMILSITVMLNMLIATMSNTFQRVTGNSYTEWVFGRTKVFLSFSMHTEVPPPLNVLPSIHCFTGTAAYLGRCCQAGAKAVVKWVSIKGKPLYTDDDFRILMAKLVRRYFRDKLSTGLANNKCNPICG